MFEKYDKLLAADLSDDYWSDEGIGIAAGQLVEFSDADWTTLKEELESRPFVWVFRCAEALGDVEDVKALDILMNIIRGEEEEIRFAALDSINSLLAIGVDIDRHTDELKKLVKSISSTSEPVKLMLKSLEKKLI